MFGNTEVSVKVATGYSKMLSMLVILFPTMECVSVTFYFEQKKTQKAAHFDKKELKKQQVKCGLN